MRLNKIREYITHELNSKSLHKCYYHGTDHSLEVELACIEISEQEKNITPLQIELLRIAALSHDIGHIENMDNHEVLGCNFISKLMPQYGYKPEDIAIVETLIMVTKFPHNPKSLLENIICDADLAYLGSGKYNEQSEKLKKELIELHNYELNDDIKWTEFQINFLEKHVFFTKFAKDNYNPNKDKIIQKLKDKLTLL